MAKIYDSKRYNSGTVGKRYTYVTEVTYRLPSSLSFSVSIKEDVIYPVR